MPEGVAPHGVVISTWSRQASEAETVRINASRVRKLPDALRPATAGGSVRHVALATGLKP